MAEKKGRKTLLVWGLLLAAFVALALLLDGGERPHREFGVLLADVAEGHVESIQIHHNEITVSRWDGVEYVTLGVLDEARSQEFSGAGVRIEYGRGRDPMRTILLVGLPLLLILGFFVYFVKKGAQGNMSIMEVRKSRARLIGEDVGVTFADVGGCEEAKAQLADVVGFLKDPGAYTDAGVRMPRGVLLEGPPGCGKTLLARALAGETDARFYWVSASEFVELFVGVGAARVRDMFETAAKNAPAVIFIDELDAVGRKRGSGIGAGHDEREQTLNQILVCLDGFEASDRVVVIAATNRSDVLDPALMRPGRFDRRIQVPELSFEQRLDVLRIHTRDMTLDAGVSLEALGERTEGWSGAALESLVNEAGLLAVRRMRDAQAGEAALRADDFEAALTPGERERARFDAVDALLVEATSQLAQATGTARARIALAEGHVEGEIVWADANFVKLVGEGEAGAMLIPKSQIRSLQALEGTDEAIDVAADAWAASRPDTA